MTLPLSVVFVLAPAAGLSVFLLAWLTGVWRRNRLEKSARRPFVCPSCQGRIPDLAPSVRLRCPHCGALHRRISLAVKA
jgi:predicted RNA-binding Zn-ribbon protein involved in translation (DUF1610 family)